jgi:hypothetical protein
LRGSAGASPADEETRKPSDKHASIAERNSQTHRQKRKRNPMRETVIRNAEAGDPIVHDVVEVFAAKEGHEFSIGRKLSCAVMAHFS